MRIALVSDIHGNLAALEAVAADIQRRQVDRAVNLGDSLSGPLLPLETARFLISSSWLSISGNHDRQLLALRPGTGGPSDAHAHAQLTAREFAWLRSLEPSIRLEDEVYCCHGTPRNDSEYLTETIEDGGVRLATDLEIAERLGDDHPPVVVCGHTHVPRSVSLGEDQLIVNPGSVGLPAYRDEQPVAHVVETGSPNARYAIIERTSGVWIAEQITVPYDHRAMAALAARRNRPDWEHALRSGYVD